MANFAEYKTRILSYVEGKDPLAVQRQTPELLAEVVAGVGEPKLRERPGSDKWSVAELLAHLADAEVGCFWRYRQMIEHDGSPLLPYDQELWSSLGNNGSRSPAESVQLFRLLRESNIGMLERLSSEQWERHGMHAERGRMSVRDLATQIAGHDLNHLEQIRKILAG